MSEVSSSAIRISLHISFAQFSNPEVRRVDSLPQDTHDVT
jgi:hypothetical protein